MKWSRANRRKAVRARRALPKIPKIRIDWRRVLVPPLVLSALGAASLGAQALLDRPVRTLEFEGTFQRVTPLAIEAAVAPELAAGFLSLDLEAVRARVLALDWVDRVEVARSWPGRLVVRVTEHQAAARWRETGLLNVRGELFTDSAQHALPELPALAGPPGTEQEVAALYLAVRGRLAAAHLSLESLTLDERGAWEFVLAGGQQIRLGRREVDERLERFFAVVPYALADEFARVEYVDLRYTNGFAVGWTEAEAGGTVEAGSVVGAASGPRLPPTSQAGVAVAAQRPQEVAARRPLLQEVAAGEPLVQARARHDG